MTKTFTFFALMICIGSSALHAQDSTQSAPTDSLRPTHQPSRGLNGWYIEIAGQSVIGATFNYERSLSSKPGGFILHAGLGGFYININEHNLGYLNVPVGLSYAIPISKNKTHFLEVGANYTFSSWTPVYNGSISWRFAPPSKKVLTRLTVIPYFFAASTDGDLSSFGPFFGFSIGRRF